MDRRLLVGSVAAAAVIAVGGGWLVAANRDDETVQLDRPGGVEGPGLGTNAAVEGAPLPSVVLRDVDGNVVDVASLSGEPLVLNFWNADCAPCKREMPVLAASASALDGTVRFVGVNTADTADRAEEFAAEYGADYLQLLDPNGDLVTQVGVGLLPTTLFVDADGQIVLQKAGELTQSKLDAAVAEAFGQV